MKIRQIAAQSIPAILFALPLAALDLTQAVVVAPAALDGAANKAVRSLVEEVEKRTAVRLPVGQSWPSDGAPAIAVGPLAKAREFAGEFARDLDSADKPGAEGYVMRTGDNAVVIGGADPRGVLFGVGHLLRKLEMRAGVIRLPHPLNLSTTPETGLRGHQLGYRPKTNSYDAWTAATWEQYIRELALFGANAIEIIPPRSDDDADSPHFPLPQIDMMAEQSRIGDEYGQDIWIWYPALDENYGDPKDIEFALKEWAEVYKRLPRIDYMFVPGGDPGHTRPVHLFDLLEQQTALLKKYHPNAEMWMSPQSFNAEWMEEFYGLMDKRPEWLGGIVFGPQQRVGLPELRRRIPQKYPIRRYPDITHSRHCQYPVPDWDLAYAVTEAREVINPRPVDQARIYRLLDEYAVGFLTYSEGNHDDVNKFIWSALGWERERNVVDILRDYSRFFIGPDYADSWAQGMLALERNWRGPLAQNEGVYTTLARFRSMEKTASPQLKLNWRFQHGLYRAYYDAYNRSRLLYETALEDEAMSHLRRAPVIGSRLALDLAQAALDRGLAQPISQDWRGARLRARRSAVPKHPRATQRSPLPGDPRRTRRQSRHRRHAAQRPHLAERTVRQYPQARFRARPAERDRSGSQPHEPRTRGGFYDDLGNLLRQPHLVRGKGYENDPAHLESSLVGFAIRDEWMDMPLAWWRHAEALNDAPLQLRYDGLDPAAQYRGARRLRRRQPASAHRAPGRRRRGSRAARTPCPLRVSGVRRPPKRDRRRRLDLDVARRARPRPATDAARR